MPRKQKEKPPPPPHPESETPFQKFERLARRLVAVPKSEIDKLKNEKG